MSEYLSYTLQLWLSLRKPLKKQLPGTVLLHNVWLHVYCRPVKVNALKNWSKYYCCLFFVVLYASGRSPYSINLRVCMYPRDNQSMAYPSTRYVLATLIVAAMFYDQPIECLFADICYICRSNRTCTREGKWLPLALFATNCQRHQLPTISNAVYCRRLECSNAEQLHRIAGLALQGKRVCRHVVSDVILFECTYVCSWNRRFLSIEVWLNLRVRFWTNTRAGEFVGGQSDLIKPLQSRRNEYCCHCIACCVCRRGVQRRQYHSYTDRTGQIALLGFVDINIIFPSPTQTLPCYNPVTPLSLSLSLSLSTLSSPLIHLHTCAEGVQVVNVRQSYWILYKNCQPTEP